MSQETKVKNILDQKLIKDVKSITAEETVFEALKVMAINNVGALLVMEKDRVIGIITERDYARKVVLKDRSSRDTKVSEIMERKVLYVVPGDTAQGCMKLMTAKRVRHLPVLEKEKIIGLVSIGDVVKAVINDHEHVIEQLICYTTGSAMPSYGSFNLSADSEIEERLL